MNWEFFAIGMMEYGGIGLLIVVGLFVAALNLVRALRLPIATRYENVPAHQYQGRASLPSRQSQTNQ